MASAGLHARPAALFTQAAAACGQRVTIGRDDQAAVDAASILMVMSLGLKHGEEVVLTVDADGAEDADSALDELAALLATDLDAVVER